MKRNRCTIGAAAVSLIVGLAAAPSVWAVNYVVDGLNGDDANSGITATGGPGDLAGLDFSDAFQTIAKATSLIVSGDAIFVNAGRYGEGAVLNLPVSLIAVGEVIIENAPKGVHINGAVGATTVEGFTIQDCPDAVYMNTNGTASITNLKIHSCPTGLNLQTGTQDVRRCVITDCRFGISVTSNTTADIEQCTLVGNTVAVEHMSVNSVFRNNLVAFNTLDGIRASGGLLDFNDVFGNGTDYVAPAVPGPHDISVDPLFIDLSRRILTLRPTSPLINAGEELGGGPPVTIGARECGFASSNALDGWADWIDENGVLVTSGLSTVVEIDAGTGQIILKPGVSRASVRSPAFDKGPLKTLQFAALEDLAQPTGSRRVIDHLDTTFQRELRFRASDTAFAATDAVPVFETVFEHQELSLATNRRFVQVELTLTNAGL